MSEVEKKFEEYSKACETAMAKKAEWVAATETAKELKQLAEWGVC